MTRQDVAEVLIGVILGFGIVLSRVFLRKIARLQKRVNALRAIAGEYVKELQRP